MNPAKKSDKSLATHIPLSIIIIPDCFNVELKLPWPSKQSLTFFKEKAQCY